MSDRTCRNCGGSTLDMKGTFYGGMVCSRACDFRVSLDLERTMPGHSPRKEHISQLASESLARNRWEDR